MMVKAASITLSQRQEQNTSAIILLSGKELKY